MPERYYHPDYRKNEASAIIKALDQGACVSVIGPPSVGNRTYSSSWTGNPTRRPIPRVLGALCAERHPPGRIVSVSIDPNALLPALPNEKGDIAAHAWPGFELLTYRTTITPPLYPAFSAVDRTADSEFVRQIARLQERLRTRIPI